MVVERDANALAGARLLAVVQIVGFYLFQPHLAVGIVARLVIFFGTLFHYSGLHEFRRRLFLAASAPVVATPMFMVVRDGNAPCGVLARLLARFESAGYFP